MRTRNPYEANKDWDIETPKYKGAQDYQGPRIEMDAKAARDPDAESPPRRDVEEVAFLESRYGGLECSHCHGVEETQLTKTMVRLAKEAIPNFKNRTWGRAEVQREPERRLAAEEGG